MTDSNVIICALVYRKIEKKLGVVYILSIYIRGPIFYSTIIYPDC